MRSNANKLEVFDRYDKFLMQNKIFGKEFKAVSDAFLYHLVGMAAMEVERFLLDEGLPQSYGYLASIDPYTHAVEWHRLYRVPFCDACNRNFEYRRAPWLDEVTLGDICEGHR
ncbi:MAG: hypothetical protein KatS3mg119_0453 [Rhodothalassiaceae bacterium]|nr:MAG: hypothetical protein KatS3mg119_0453 [Rhodothalassiaceae bacterium]